MGPKQGAQLLMPRLGEAVEPAQGEAVTPWWRAADVTTGKRVTAVEPEDASKMPKAMPWPLD